ncbi:MAG: helix-turn-helix transcriptional regulator [Oscillospiraceae bacterium]|nr:helix-turn-helix transcriptional regulator [Oscillospiraceae bacterium]
MLSFGERLKKARERKGLSQKQVMALINLSDKSLSRYETNSSAPDPDTIQELIRLYDVSADYILGLSPIMGHAPESVGAAGTSTAAPAIASDPDVHEMLEGLSDEAREKAEEYIEMLKTLDEVQSGKNFIDFKKKA